MLALSIQQPWAWLITHGWKDVENRSWPTKFRGTFLVHAGKKIDTAAIPFIRLDFPQIPLPEIFETGGIVGEARLVACVQRHLSPWFCGPYGFVIQEGKARSFQACRGQLGFFEVSTRGEG